MWQRIVGVVLFAVALCGGLYPVCSQDSFVREWQAAGGVTTLASFVGFDPQTQIVKLRIASSGVERTIPLNVFTEADRVYVQLQSIIRQDREQFERVSQHLESLRTTPETTIAILKELAKIFPSSPYASVWGSVASAAGLNQVEDAVKQTQEAIGRINKDHRKLDSSRHLRTLVSAYNNLAVCFIKKREADSAARYFLDAMELVERTPPVLSHNIRFLQELSSERGALKLDPKYKAKLVSAIARLPVEDPKKKLEDGWYYSLDLDVPSAMENELSVSGVYPPDPTLELIASGTGIVCAPGFVVTVRPAVVHPYRAASLASVAIPLSKDRWALKPAQRVFVAEPRQRVTSGSRHVAESISDSTSLSRFQSQERTNAGLNSIGLSVGSDSRGVDSLGVSIGASQSFSETATSGNSASHSQTQTSTQMHSTNYVVDNPADGTTEAELAILRIDGLNIDPCLFSENHPTVAVRLGVLGYQRGPEMLKTGLQKKPGTVVSIQSDTQFTIDTSILGGDRGGACFDASYRVFGIAWATGQKPAGGYCYTTDAIKNWFATVSQTADLRFAESAEPSSEERLKNATLPVLVWGRRSDLDMSNPIYSQFYQEENLIDRFVVRDNWCFKCGGDGLAFCTRCVGTGEIIDGTVPMQVNTNLRTGEPIYANRPNKVRCPGCSGRKNVTCTSCQNGKLPGRANLGVRK